MERGLVFLKYIASVSFGKDSLAMLLKLIENNKQIDEVVFFDTQMEFGCIYNIKSKVEHLLREKGFKFTTLTNSKPFIHLMLEHEINHRNGTSSCGYKWCGGSCRWFTTYKTNTIKNYLKRRYGNDYREYIGIAFDEPQRIEKALSKGKLLPLIDYEMTEYDCLNYCHEKGFYWLENGKELYDYLDRVSCWCCRNKNLKELRAIKEHFNVYWLALCELERRCGMSMKNKPLKMYEKDWSEDENS